MLLVASGLGTIMMCTYICTGASVIFQMGCSALTCAAAEHFVGGIARAGFSRDDLGLAYPGTMMAGVTMGCIAIVRIASAAALEVVTVTLRRRNVRNSRCCKGRGTVEPEPAPPPPFIVQMGDNQEIIDEEHIPSETKGNIVVADILDQSSPVTLHQGMARANLAQGGGLDADIPYNVSENKVIGDTLPAWMAWLLCRGLCKPASMAWLLCRGLCKKSQGAKASSVSQTEDIVTGEEEPVPCPFCCLPRSMLCDCITGEPHVSGARSRDLGPHEIQGARIDLSCCDHLVCLPHQLPCCVVASAPGDNLVKHDVAMAHGQHPSNDEELWRWGIRR